MRMYPVSSINKKRMVFDDQGGPRLDEHADSEEAEHDGHEDDDVH